MSCWERCRSAAPILPGNANSRGEVPENFWPALLFVQQPHPGGRTFTWTPARSGCGNHSEDRVIEGQFRAADLKPDSSHRKGKRTMQTLVRLIAAGSLVVGLAACGYQ